MFISKKKYQETINGYRRLCANKDDQIYSLQIERDNLKDLVKVLENRIKRIEDKEVINERKV